MILHERNPLVRAALVAAVKEAHEYNLERDDRLARKVVAELGEALKRGRKFGRKR